MENYNSIRLIALDAVLTRRRRKAGDPIDPDYEMRRVCREYSERFHTPLADVYDLPIDDVLRDYWEAAYEDLGERPREKHDQDPRTYLERERDLLVATDAERAEQEQAEAEVADDDAEFIAQVIAEEDAARKAQEVAAEQLRKAAAAIQKVGANLHLDLDDEDDPLEE